MAFIGRTAQLRRLTELLARATSAADARPGAAVLIRGRRRVGKSRLVEEFVAGAGVPSVYFTASGRPPREELRLFAAEVAASDLPGAEVFDGVELASWDAALRLLASVLPDSGSVVVVDELPYLTASDPGFEGTLQKMFDRELSRRRVLLIGIGSDLAMMEALNSYGRPFHQRATEMVVPPLSPAEVGAMLSLASAEAFDAFLVTGGLPLICAEWPPGLDRTGYLAGALAEPTSALLVSAERALAAEFPVEAQARTVLSAVGRGERTFSNIGRAAGDLQQASLNRSLRLLAEKRMISVDQPLSTKASPKDKRYRVSDPYLRFWLAFLGPGMPEIERGRGDRVHRRIEAGWAAWRGRAIEPVLRESVLRLPLAELLAAADVGAVGGYWTRTNDPEVDLVFADREPVARVVHAVGAIKWREKAPFDARDLSQLVRHRAQVPGASDETPLVVVSRAGCAVENVIAVEPAALLAAWE
ncbi:ATP-binding protein [Sporichthya polymorpha]|uniref:ATP-binding protein n=1 Tax=Sporichthya polymorpha TaxID=35751 RepID=UPI0003A9F942|nr:ATP-binding protein [Sporichthya polymorpha]